MVDVAQLVRAPVCGTGGRGFKSRHPPHTQLLDPSNNSWKGFLYIISSFLSFKSRFANIKFKIFRFCSGCEPANSSGRRENKFTARAKVHTVCLDATGLLDSFSCKVCSSSDNGQFAPICAGQHSGWLVRLPAVSPVCLLTVPQLLLTKRPGLEFLLISP